MADRAYGILGISHPQAESLIATMIGDLEHVDDSGKSSPHSPCDTYTVIWKISSDSTVSKVFEADLKDLETEEFADAISNLVEIVEIIGSASKRRSSLVVHLKFAG